MEHILWVLRCFAPRGTACLCSLEEERQQKGVERSNKNFVEIGTRSRVRPKQRGLCDPQVATHKARRACGPVHTSCLGKSERSLFPLALNPCVVTTLQPPPITTSLHMSAIDEPLHRPDTVSIRRGLEPLSTVTSPAFN